MGSVGGITGHAVNLSLCVNWSSQELAKPGPYTTKDWAGRSWQPWRVEDWDWEERHKAGTWYLSSRPDGRMDLAEESPCSLESWKQLPSSKWITDRETVGWEEMNAALRERVWRATLIIWAAKITGSLCSKVVKSWDSRAGLSGSESWLCHLLIIPAWASHLWNGDNNAIVEDTDE